MVDDISPQRLEPETLRKGFQLEPWRVLPDQNLIQNDSREVHLEPKVMEVLLCLVKYQGEVVSRDTLIDEVWNTVVTDEVLSRAISLLRTCLEDDSKAPVYIQTVPKKGYRLIKDIKPLVEGHPNGTGVPSNQTTLPAKKVVYGIVALAVLAVLLILLAGQNGSRENGILNFADWFDLVEAEADEAGQITSVAVLPFDNLSGNAANDYFSDGLTDEITMSLTRVDGLKVVARSTAYSLKKNQADVPTLGKLLNVDAILEGSVRQSDERFRINAQLSSAKDGYVLWSESYEGELSRAFNIQETVALATAQALKNVVGAETLEIPERETVRPHPEAYRLYLNARFLWKLRGEKTLRRSATLYEQALEIDPTFNRAKIALADSLVILPFYSQDSMEEMFVRAEGILDGISPGENWEHSESESIRGFIAMHRWQWAEAEQHFRRAIELEPENAAAYNWFAQFLSIVGRHKDALKAAEKARQLDGVSPVINSRLAVSYMWLNDQVRAAELFALSNELGFSNRINMGYIVFLVREKRYREFQAIIELLNPPGRPQWLVATDDLNFLHADKPKALRLAKAAQAEGDAISPTLEFGMWMVVGGVDETFEFIDRYADTNNRKLIHLEMLFAKEGEAMRKDRRFKALVDRIGLTDYWATFGEPDHL
ncbi:MAG: winged helix-turn-helix domain-containing protein [bacterium]